MSEAPQSTSALIRADRVTLAYPGHLVVRDLCLEIEAGQFWCLLGANGTGKTSLLRAILGLLAVQSGRLDLAPSLSPASIGFVPQTCNWSRSVPTTVREFVSLGAVGLGLGAAERTARLHRALGTVALDGQRSHDLWSLSGGQRQRAMIARALVRQPRLLLLDEPTASLDPAAEQSVLDLVARVNRDDGVTVMLVTHDLAVADRHATHVALFHAGRVDAGRRSAVLHRDNLERIYGPSSHGWIHGLGECGS